MDYLKNNIIYFVMILLVVAGFGTAFYYYTQVNKTVDPQQATQEEKAALIAAISKLMVLPENEDPTVATVSDPELLKNQPFFANAKKGDKVLIYTNAKKAILYDPVSNKILEVAPVSLGTPPTATESGNKKSK